MSQLPSDALLERAQRVLKENNRGSFSIPAKGLYPYRWYWDSAFIALGFAAIDERRAWAELEASMSGQWPSGMVPSIDFHEAANDPGGYFPGADIWRSPHNRTSGITQPTVTPQIALELYEKSDDKELAKEALKVLYAPMMNAHRWLYNVRRADDTGWLLCTHPWETGMDNSPAWEEALDAMGDVQVPTFERQDNKGGNKAHRPTDEFYKRAYSLLLTARKHGYDTREATDASPFAVVDVGFNSLAVEASAALVEIGKILGKDVTEATEWLELGKAGIVKLWNEELGIFTSWNWRTGKGIQQATSAGFLPLLTDAVTPEHVVQLSATAMDWSRKVEALGDGPGYLVPSIDPSNPLFDPDCYWRGPAWINVNYLNAKGFARHRQHEIAERIQTDTVELINLSGFREYFHPNTGEGLGSDNFGWTAAILLGGIDRELLRRAADNASEQVIRRRKEESGPVFEIEHGAH